MVGGYEQLVGKYKKLINIRLFMAWSKDLLSLGPVEWFEDLTKEQE